MTQRIFSNQTEILSQRFRVVLTIGSDLQEAKKMGQEIRKAYADSSLGQIHYRIGGQGKPLLLVHQDPQSALQFLYVMPLLIDAGFQVIAPDMPGYGLSEGSSEPSTIPEYADVLVQLLDHL